MILSHRQPEQVLRLMHRLASMFPDAPILCHHDLSQSRIERERLPASASLVEPHRATAWAEFSVVEATVDMIRALAGRERRPRWMILLSGADYPVAPARRIREVFRADDVDAFIQYQPLDPADLRTVAERRAWERYFHRRFEVQVPTFRGRGHRIGRTVWNRHLMRAMLPYSERFRCYFGSQWFAIGTHAARVVLREHRHNRRHRAHAARVKFSEETYFQTMLANAPGLRLRNEHLRYMDWSADGWHPATLTVDDLPRVLGSGALFARKFDIDRDVEVLDRIDRALEEADLAATIAAEPDARN